MEQEKWMPVQGYEGLYEVSNMGRIKSLAKRWSVGVKQETILKPSGKKDDYFHVVLSKDKVKETRLVHRLVAKHYCSNPHSYDVVNHLDSNKQNNCYKNLEWTTDSGNAIHGFKFGFRKGKKGEDNPRSRYKAEDIIRIREMYSSGAYSQQKIAEIYNDKQTNISRIVLRQRWQHI